MAQIGADCKCYRNTGTYDTPVWTELKLIKDLTQTLEIGTADVSNRGSGGWRIVIGTLKDGKVQFGMIWEKSDTDFLAIQAAWNSKSLVDLAVMDGDITTEGTTGLRAEMSVLTFTRAEPLDGPVMADVNCQPGSIANAPIWMIIAEE